MDNEKNLSGGKKLLYSRDQTPPVAVLLLSSLQHMLLLLSLGMALPVAVARAAGCDLRQSASLLAAALFGMGFATILQTIPGKFIGSGYQSLSCTDSATLSVSVLMGETGGVPLVLGMTLFSGGLRFALGSFAYRLRKLFPPEVTGAMIFILGINLVPTSFKYFLGTNGAGDPRHLIVAGATLLFIMACSLFIKPLKPYSALAGIVFGYILSALMGVFDLSSLSVLGERGVLALPVYSDLAFRFDAAMIMPVVIVTVAAVVDNIGDLSATQSINDPSAKKVDWRSVERGIRGGALGMTLAALVGGSFQATATTNIGIAGATGITSRKVGYVAGGMLIVLSFFPAFTGILSMIPEPVLGAVLMYSMCYIMKGGISTIAELELDDRRIFTIFLSIGAAVSTLIPGLYAFLPDNVAQVLVSPMVMGVAVLLITTLIGRIGIRRKFAFQTGVTADDVYELEKELQRVCREWGTDRMLYRKLCLSLDSLAEGLCEQSDAIRLHFRIQYDRMQVKLHVETEGGTLREPEGDSLSSLSIALAMLPNLFDTVKTSWEGGNLALSLDADL